MAGELIVELHGIVLVHILSEVLEVVGTLVKCESDINAVKNV